MTPIKIERPVLVNGARIEGYSARDRGDLIQTRENEIKKLEALEFKTQETIDEIAAARKNLADVIAEFDAEYAARKAAAAAK